jgi:hypothetical protein
MGCIWIRFEAFVCYAKEVTQTYGQVSALVRHLIRKCVFINTHYCRTLGPGADIILGRLSFNPDILIGEMTAAQLDEVAVKFDQWPLRPRVLFEDASVFV